MKSRRRLVSRRGSTSIKQSEEQPHRPGCRTDAARLDRCEEREQTVIGLKAPKCRARWGDLGEGLFLQRDACVQIAVGGLDALVSEPERDDGDVHSCIKQRHSGSMSDRVRRDALLPQTGTAG